ncbi:MAG: hypothetical protein AAFQ47_13600 [Pseudomonadota bacterium]
MSNRVFFLVALVLLGFSPHPAKATQAYSESLMDCAVLFNTSNRINPERADHGKGLALSRIAEALEKAAHDQAVNEGQDAPESYLSQLKASKISHWDGKGLTYVFSDEFRDWMTYCRKFAGHLGIDFKNLP